MGWVWRRPWEGGASSGMQVFSDQKRGAGGEREVASSKPQKQKVQRQERWTGPEHLLTRTLDASL